MFVLLGFILCAIATTIAFLEMDFFHHQPPFDVFHPIKVLGNIGGIAIIIGLIIMIARHGGDSEISGKMTYSLGLFIVMVVLVVLSGFGAQFFRMGNVAELAYPIYYLHILTVFFLLLYAPYSFFGHMFYRTLAMVFARSIGRLPQEFATD